MKLTRHDRTDRIGMGVFVFLANLLFDAVMGVVGGLAWKVGGPWLAVPVFAVAVIVATLLTVSGISAVARRGRAGQ